MLKTVKFDLLAEASPRHLPSAMRHLNMSQLLLSCFADHLRILQDDTGVGPPAAAE